MKYTISTAAKLVILFIFIAAVYAAERKTAGLQVSVTVVRPPQIKLATDGVIFINGDTTYTISENIEKDGLRVVTVSY